MEITINKKPCVDKDGYYSECYSLKTVLKTVEEASALEVLEAVYKAMTIEGYYPYNIVKGMKEFIENWELENEKVIMVKKD